MNETQEVQSQTNNLYDKLQGIRDDIMRTLGITDVHELFTDLNNEINEAAQLKTGINGCPDNPKVVAEVRERISYLMWGRKHPNRVDRNDI